MAVPSPTIKINGEPIVTFIGICYQQIPILAYSLLAQTYPNWRLYLYHDGPVSSSELTTPLVPRDWRIQYEIRTENSGNRWGHPLRTEALERIKAGTLFPETTHVIVTNADNYYVPGFCERMLRPLEKNKGLTGTYSQFFGHSYQDWRLIETAFGLGHIDCCCVLATKAAACELGWRSHEEASDWTYIKDMWHGKGHLFKKVDGCLVIHN